MGRKPCCDKEGVNRGAWSVMEDQILTNYINAHGEGKWKDLPLRAGLNRCGKSCRLRWLNYLRPDIKRGNISEDEEQLIIRLHNLLGNRWSLIAGRLPGRTDNEIKNFWNTNLSKRVEQNNSHNKPQNPSISRAHHQPAMKRTKTSSLDASFADAALSSHHSHPVIRTKAVRCTKLQVGLPLMHEPSAAAQRESQSGSASMSTTIQDEKKHLCSYGVLQDFDIDELLIPEDVPEGPCTSYLQHHDNDDVLNEQYYSGDFQMHGDANNIDVSVGGDEMNPQSWMAEGFFQRDYYEDVDLYLLNLELD